MVAVAEFEGVAAIGELAGEWSQHARQPSGRLQTGWIGGDQYVAATRDDRAFRKFVARPIDELPGREIDVDRHLVVQFDPFATRAAVRRMIIYLVENHHTVHGRGAVAQDEK